MTKTCSRCLTEQPEEAFHRHPTTADRRHTVCRSCVSAYGKARYAADPERFKAYVKARYSEDPARQRAYAEANRNRTRARAHGITLERYLAMAAAGCGVCGRALDVSDPKSPAHVDHDHACCPGKLSCGKCVRAILCRWCNCMIGHAKDDPARLRAGADYLDRFPKAA